MQHILQKYFGYNDFRPLQKEIISDILEGKDTFALMPTGGGKSLCYQLPALMMDGVTVVISPLISLMKDQVDNLKANGIEAEYLNSTLGYSQMKQVHEKLIDNQIKILYVAPERLIMSDTFSYLKKGKVSMFAVDEAHCISEWGHDFRPEYRRLNILKKSFRNVPIVALTATASPKVEKDIIKQLSLEDCRTYRASFNRKNLFYHVKAKKDTYRQLKAYLKIHRGESGIIYCQSRSLVETLSKRLNKDGFKTLAYHAGLSDFKRECNQNSFIQDNIDIIVATVAFGMGIDKPDVRFVIHYDLPKNLESYYQETGRGGRDGLPCECILFFSYADKYKIEYFIEQKRTKEERDAALMQLRKMINYCESTQCRRKVLLEYFGETHPESNCKKCDVCLNPKEKFEGTKYAEMILKCIKELDQRYGACYTVDVLTGSGSKKIQKNSHHLLESYGKGKLFTKKQWLDILRELINKGILEQKGGRYPILNLNDKSEDVLNGNLKIELTVPSKSVNIISEKRLTEEAISGLFESLRKLRKQIADEQNVPPYIIFSDKSLMEMAAMLPENHVDFLKIHGVGEHKLKKYGPAFINEIRSCRQNHDSRGLTKDSNHEPIIERSS